MTARTFRLVEALPLGSFYIVPDRWAKWALILWEGVPSGAIRIRPYIPRNGYSIATPNDLREMDAGQGYVP